MATECVPGSYWFDRYWCIRDRIVLDTKPALLPESPADISPIIEPYLRLVAQQPQIPQVYAVLPNEEEHQPDLYLLESAPIGPGGPESGATDDVTAVDLLPAIAAVWATSSGLRQLHWLWQLALLWDELAHEGVAQSLCTPDLIRVEGGLVRLLELRTSPTPVSLADLGRVWQGWAAQAQADVATFLKALCQRLITGQMQSGAQVVELLEAAIAQAAQAYQYQFQVAVLTDQGPTRQRNEDACFPESGTELRVDVPAGNAPTPQLLTIVCDGIGGHEGGNVASNLAIATLQQHWQAHIPTQTMDAPTLSATLENATVAANDAICQRNDAEHRYERQRMGTTVVMAAVQGHQLYLAHIGDSRAYRITATGCHQVTLDDDLAAREVRLGYSLYREAVRQPTGGSLVQALGMNSSSVLRPTTRPFVLDEDCVFLLCSDGLSDRDRVEQSWQRVVVPVLQGAVDIATAVQQLVAIANQQNGHDNVTVALIHGRVFPMTPPPLLAADLANQPVSAPTQLTPTAAPSTAGPNGTVLGKTRKVTRYGQPPLTWLKILLIVLGAGSAMTYGLIQGINWLEQRQSMQSGSDLAATASPSSSAIPPLPEPSTSQFTLGTRLLVNRAAPPGSQNPDIVLVPRPTATPDPGLAGAVLPLGSVVEVVRQQRDETNRLWLRLRVCSVPSERGAGLTVAAGDLGWVPEVAIAPRGTANVSLTPTQLGACASEQRRPGQSSSPPSPPAPASPVN